MAKRQTETASPGKPNRVNVQIRGKTWDPQMEMLVENGSKTLTVYNTNVEHAYEIIRKAFNKAS